jgi:hypothetical protein
VKLLVAAALVGVVHVHHAPSHDSDAPFEEVAAAAHEVGLDFLVLTDHYESAEDGALPGGEHVGVHRDATGHAVLVLAGAEFGTTSGHLLGLRIPRAYANLDEQGELRSSRELIARIQADGGFALVPHPTSHGSWSDWEAPFDGLEVQNHASDFRRQLGLLLPVRLVRFLYDREAGLARMLRRPTRELERWEQLLRSGRHVVGFAGADVHRNASFLGAQLDPYAQQFRPVQTLCPDGPLEPDHVWGALLAGRCRMRWRIHESNGEEVRELRFPSGRVELQLGDGSRVLEVRNPPSPEPPRGSRDRPSSR